MEFNAGVEPTLLRIVFVARHESVDAPLYQELNKLVGFSRSETMKLLSLNDLEIAVALSAVVTEHPIYELLVDADVEDLAAGGSQARDRFLSRATRRKISYADLQKMKEQASRIGLLGEQFVNDYLTQLEDAGEIDSFEWVAKRDAVSPYDFWVSTDGSAKIYIDVKTTAGEFERLIHVSYNELRQMSEGSMRYDLYRVFGIDGEVAQLRIAKDVRAFADTILNAILQLPQGVSADNFSFSPTVLTFDREILLQLDDPTRDVE